MRRLRNIFWRTQRLYDKIIDMPHIHEKIDFTAEAFIVCENKVLLRIHDKLKVWMSIGGHIELDEDPVEASVGRDVDRVRVEGDDTKRSAACLQFFLKRITCHRKFSPRADPTKSTCVG